MIFYYINANIKKSILQGDDVMIHSHEKYKCYPSVICVGKETEITIFPRDLSRRFREDKDYELAIKGSNEDEIDYHCSLPLTQPFALKDGCLHFTFVFEQEQEYIVHFREKGGQLIKIPIYAVEEDLYELRPLKGDLHTHSYYSDGIDGIPVVPADYREQGFDFFALTDHNRMYPSTLAAKLYGGIPLGMNIIRGEEVHTPDSQLHIVHVGGNESVCNKYIHHNEDFEKAVQKIELTMSYAPEQYRYRLAMAKWACNEIHKAGGIAIFAHPYWRPRNYNITKEFDDLLFDEKMFDAFEVMGGTGSDANNKQVALWQEQLAKGNLIPLVGSSDSHNHDFDADVFGHCFTYVFAKSNQTKDILDAIRRGYCVSCELPKNNEDEPRFYSTKLRFVLFAHFLYHNYFKETLRLCFGEGVLMRRYAEGEPVGDILASLADSVEHFYKRFYGLTSAPIIPKERQEFMDECLYMQRHVGPTTKGSSLSFYGSNARHE